MKLTRRQLRRLIEASVIKRGDDYVAPIEDPLTDPRDFDFNLSDENKGKLLDLARGDDASQAQADSLADTLDFPKSGRFGADTLSKQMKMYDMGLDVLNDPEIDQLLDRAIELYFDQKGGYFADDLIDVMDMGYVYKDFQTFLDGDPNFDDSDGGNADLPMLHIDMVNSVMDKVNMLIGVKLMNLNYYNPNQSININLVRDLLDPEELKLAKQLSPEELNQLTNKLRKAAELFKRRTSEESLPAVTQHVYDKMTKPMYKIYTSVIRKHPKGDFSKLKEGKIKITRRQLRQIIEASIIKKDDYTIPVEQPIEDPLKDLDYDEDQKGKIKNLAMSGDEETKVHADFLADVGGYEGTDDRFGIDSFSDQVTLTALDINKLLKDPDLYSLLDEAANYWVHMNQEDIVDFDTINNSSTYSEFARNVILDDPNIQDTDAHHLKPVIVDIALDKLTMTGLDKYSKMMDLFSTSGIAFVDNLIYDALELNGSLYELYKDWKQYYMSGERDIPEEELTPELKAKFANIKEGRR